MAFLVLLWTQWISWAVRWYLLFVVSWQTTLKFSSLKWWLLYKLCFCALINYSWTFFWRSYLGYLMSLHSDGGRVWSCLDARMLHPSWDIQNGSSTRIYDDWLGASLCNCFFTTVPCPPGPLSSCVAGILTCWSGLLRAYSGKVLAIVSLRPDVGTVLLLSHFVA